MEWGELAGLKRSSRRDAGMMANPLNFDRCSDCSNQRLCGPRGIRTPDLLNAIETRSQLRYGPLSTIWLVNPAIINTGGGGAPSGPEGIRTPDLFSAIEARSQLRYRPFVE